MTDNLQKANEILDGKSLFLLDIDGTVYFGKDKIKGADDFIRRVRETGRDFVFITNNSSNGVDILTDRLINMGFDVTRDNFFTPAQASAECLRASDADPCVYVVGTTSFKNELRSLGINVTESGDGANFVLAAYDLELTYDKIRRACGLVCDGVPFYATNPDIRCPADGGRYLPDCASICNMITLATEKEPYFIGKPHADMALCAIKAHGKNLEDAVMIGDRLYTDIKCGINAGITTALVLSGEATKEDVEKEGIEPDIILDSVADIQFRTKRA